MSSSLALTDYLAAQTAIAINGALPRHFPQQLHSNSSSNETHWSQHLSNLASLVMLITAVAAAIIANYPLAIICAASTLTHFISRHYIGEFLVYKEFINVNTELKQRLAALEQNEQLLKTNESQLEATRRNLHAELTEHHSFVNELQRKFDIEIADLTKATDRFQAIKAVADRLKESASKINSDASTTATQLRSLEAKLRQKEIENLAASGTIAKLSFAVEQLTGQISSIRDENAKIQRLLADIKASKVKAGVNRVDEVEQTTHLRVAAETISILLETQATLRARISELQREVSIQAAEISALKADALASII